MWTFTMLICWNVERWHGGATAPSVDKPGGTFWMSTLDLNDVRVGAYVGVDPTASALPALVRDLLRDRGLFPFEHQVVGVGGATVRYERGVGVRVDGRVLPRSLARAHDNEGRMLPKPLPEVVLAPDEVWLYAADEDGLDSRYFGPVRTQALTLHATPLLPVRLKQWVRSMAPLPSLWWDVALWSVSGVFIFALALGHRSRFGVIASLGCLGAAAICASNALGLMFVYTPSVPVGFYRRHALPPRATVGEYVCVDAVSAYAPGDLRRRVRDGQLPAAWTHEPLVKRVVGAGGATVTADRDGVKVDGVPVPKSVAHAQDGLGHALPSPPYPVTLRSDEVWLASTHSEGFDSRYFGAVNRAALSCVAEPVWTW
jgi:conjugative transfer signal peptidase TraF